MLAFEGDRVFIQGDVIQTRTNPQGVTLKVSKEDAAALRDEFREAFEGIEPKYRPGWLKNNANVICFKSQFDVPVFVGETDYPSIEALQEACGGAVLRDSKVICALVFRRNGNKAGVYLKSITFAWVNAVTLKNFFNEGGDGREE